MGARSQFAQGTKFLISDRDDTEPEYLEIAELTNIDGPDSSADEIDYTSHSSPEGWREFIQGLKDAGQVNIEGNIVTDESEMLTADEAQEELDEAFNFGGHIPMAIAWPIFDEEDEYLVLEFTGFLTSRRQITAPVDDLLSFSATIKITGELPIPEKKDLDTLDPNND